MDTQGLLPLTNSSVDLFQPSGFGLFATSLTNIGAELRFCFGGTSSGVLGSDPVLLQLPRFNGTEISNDGYVGCYDIAQDLSSNLIYESYFGGLGQDIIEDVAFVDQPGGDLIIIAGTSNSSDLPFPREFSNGQIFSGSLGSTFAFVTFLFNNTDPTINENNVVTFPLVQVTGTLPVISLAVSFDRSVAYAIVKNAGPLLFTNGQSTCQQGPGNAYVFSFGINGTPNAIPNGQTCYRTETTSIFSFVNLLIQSIS